MLQQAPAHPAAQWYGRPFPPPLLVSDTAEIISDPQVTVPFMLLIFNQLLLLIPQCHFCSSEVLWYCTVFTISDYFVSLTDAVAKTTLFIEVPKENI